MSKPSGSDRLTHNRPSESADKAGIGTIYWSYALGDEAAVPPEPGSFFLNDRRSITDNRDPDSTSSQDPPEPPKRNAIEVPRHAFGRRSFRPLAQWEGVVEDVTDTGFQARIIPVGNGNATGARTEFTTFEFDDLAHPGERELVANGAVFYWTVGRSTNEAGTVQNSSLVRFRRLPGPSRQRVRQAEAEAAKILKATGEVQ